MEQGPSIAVASQPPRRWLIPLIVVCLAAIAYGYWHGKSEASDLPYLFGYNLPVALVLWLVTRAFSDKRHRLRSAVVFFAIFLSLIVSSLVSHSQQKAATAELATELQAAYSSVAAAGKDDQGAPRQVDQLLDTTPRTKGEFGEAERFAKIMVNDMSSLRNTYLGDLDSIGWPRILDSERLRGDTTLIESKLMVQKAKAIVTKYREQTNHLLDNSRTKIAGLDLSENTRREFTTGFDRAMSKSRAQINAVFDLETETVSQFENIITLLDARNGAWKLANGQIVFSNQGDLDSFNSSITHIQELAKREEELENQRAEALTAALNKIKSQPTEKII